MLKLIYLDLFVNNYGLATAIDKNGNMIIEMVCKGRVLYNNFEGLYNVHIDNAS